MILSARVECGPYCTDNENNSIEINSNETSQEYQFKKKKHKTWCNICQVLNFGMMQKMERDELQAVCNSHTNKVGGERSPLTFTLCMPTMECVCVREYTQRYLHIYTRMHAHVHTHAHTFTYTKKHIYINARTCTHTQIIN